MTHFSPGIGDGGEGNISPFSRSSPYLFSLHFALLGLLFCMSARQGDTQKKLFSNTDTKVSPFFPRLPGFSYIFLFSFVLSLPFSFFGRDPLEQRNKGRRHVGNCFTFLLARSAELEATVLSPLYRALSKDKERKDCPPPPLFPHFRGNFIKKGF